MYNVIRLVCYFDKIFHHTKYLLWTGGDSAYVTREMLKKSKEKSENDDVKLKICVQVFRSATVRPRPVSQVEIQHMSP